MRNSRNKRTHIFPIFLILTFLVSIGGLWKSSTEDQKSISSEYTTNISNDEEFETAGEEESKLEIVKMEVSDISAVGTLGDFGVPYVEINGNVPKFTEAEKTQNEIVERYSELDHLGRCGVAYANVCKDIMPTQDREAIGQIRPSGWHTVKYNDIIEGNYLYNRCHLIGYQLAGENANEKNLITGTRYLNVEGMLPFENEVVAYVEETSNHVLYRVTPIFEGDNLVASGVQMEGWSIEDQGKGICFNVYCYNVQPGIVIDYVTGDSHEMTLSVDGETEKIEKKVLPDQEGQLPSKDMADYILNSNTKKIHIPSCSSVDDMKEKNKKYFTGTMELLLKEGYSPCQRCLKENEEQ